MVGRLDHRGPDEKGVYIDDCVGLGHARLSIIGLEGGVQPIHNEDESLWIVFNGEIFNYPELKKGLEGRGHRFYTMTDTEVILHLYEELGTECFRELNGQFALAIWDVSARRLVLARDRVGIRPLYYVERDGRLVFGSEVKALAEADGVELRLDPEALDQVFTFWSTLPDRSVFEGVKQLPPGHVAEVTEGGVSVRRYWALPFCPPGEYWDISREEVVAGIRERLEDAVRMQLRSDVPVGCYLSGGLDSSGISALVKSRFNADVKTFGLRFDEAGFDEGPYQEEVVAWLGTDHASLRVSGASIAAALDEVVWHGESPVLRLGPIPLYLLSGLVHRQGYKVVLTGEGADEVFGGYNIYREAKVRTFWARQPSSLHRPRLLARLYPYILDDPRGAKFLQGFFGQGLDQPADPFFSHRIRWGHTGRLKRFFSPALREQTAGYDAVEDYRATLPDGFDGWDWLAKAQYLEMELFLGGYLLSSQGDRVAMAHSVEIRVPFLDHRLIEYMARVPPQWKIRGLCEKYALKQALAPMLPPRVTARDKHPYRAPIVESLLAGEARDRTREVLSEPRVSAAGLFDPEKAGRLLRKLEAGGDHTEVDAMALAGLVTTQRVHEMFVASPLPGVDAPRWDLVVDRRSGREDVKK